MAIVAMSSLMTPIQARAEGCEGLTTEQCRDRIAETDRAIAWLKFKQRENPSETEAAFQRCKARAPSGSDISVVLNCMLNILGP